jgi:signal transduction histidine kinase
MNRRLIVAVAVGLVGAAAAATATALILFAHDFVPDVVLSNVLGGVGVDAVFIAAGLIAWYRRPDNIVGPLMIAFGFVEIVSQLYWDSALPYTVAFAVAGLIFPIFVHLFAVFPSGQLTTRFQRFLVYGMYVAVVVSAPLLLMFKDPLIDDCQDCPSNLLLVDSKPAVVDAIGAVGTVVLVAALVCTAILLVQRARRARGPTRRALAPVLAVAAYVVALLAAAEMANGLGATKADDVLSMMSGWGYPALPIAFLVGLLRTRLRRSTVADLVVELGSLRQPGEVRDAIARALGDASLQLVFWLPDRAVYVDPDGQQFDPTAEPDRAVTVIEHDGTRLAALIQDPAMVEESALVEAVGAAAGMALENARLQAELRAQLAEVRASRARLVAAGDAERRRLERDLHDGAQQRLLGIRLALQLARGRLADGGEALDELLAEADTEIVGALDELRSLARGIHPALLTDQGLSPAVAALARRASVPVDVRVCGVRLPATVEATAYFVASEALANVVKHAHATRATIEISRRNGRLVIAVTDDGVGGADGDGAGLSGLRDRVEALDGHLYVDSAPGEGTRVTAAIPCG